jgi:single-strand selective monofunctional uracil DNA glycosylase
VLEDLTSKLSANLDRLSFSFSGYVYNPLDYAWDNHREYLSRYVKKGASALFLGMNPGPYGMVQTGVPFGAVPMVRDYLKINNPVAHPAVEHPSRPVMGLNCPRTEVSGLRFWGLVESCFPNPDDFFSRFVVMNYCPLAFLDGGKTARNITPDKLPISQQKALYSLCDDYLSTVLQELGCTTLIGIGQFAMRKLAALAPDDCKVVSIIHPSPASPVANRGWAQQASAQLSSYGIWG